MQDASHGNGAQLLELLHSADTERLAQHVRANGLAAENAAMSARMATLASQIQDSRAAVEASERRAVVTAATQAELHAQLAAALLEYRTNDIICVGLRDSVARLQQKLVENQATRDKQAAQLDSAARDAELAVQREAALQEQLSQVQEDHAILADNHNHALQELAQVQLELQDSRRHWQKEHTEIAQQLLDQRNAHAQLQQHADTIGAQLCNLQQQLQQSCERCSEFETEVSAVRDTVMVLGKALGRQPRGEELPAADDPVWCRLGPLGGVQHALEVAMRHCRAQDSQLREVKAECERLEDRARSEAAQKTELQAALLDVRGLYAHAIADRDALDARTAHAEAEYATAAESCRLARARAASDAKHAAELQDAMCLLTQQVKQLEPLQQRCDELQSAQMSTAAQLSTLQVAHEKLQQSLQQAEEREADARSSANAYKAEAAHLLAANANMLQQSKALNIRMQELEVGMRQSNLAEQRLVQVQRQLADTQSRLDAMSDSHASTLARLETAKVLLQSGTASPRSEGAALSERATPAACLSRATSRGSLTPRGCAGAIANACTPARGCHAECIGSATGSGATSRPASAAIGQRSHASAGRETPRMRRAGSEAGASNVGPIAAAPVAAAPAACSDSAAVADDDGSGGPADISRVIDGGGSAASATAVAASNWPVHGEDELEALPPEVAAMLHERGVLQQLHEKQRTWQEMKCAMLSWFSKQLRCMLLRQAERSAELELQLLAQEAAALVTVREAEQAVSCAWEQAVQAAAGTLREVLVELQHTLYEDEDTGSVQECGAGSKGAGLVEALDMRLPPACNAAGAADTTQVARRTSTPQVARVLNSTETSVGRALLESGNNSNSPANESGSHGVGSTEAAKASSAEPRRRIWLTGALNGIIASLRTAAEDAAARTATSAARRDVAVDTGQPLQDEWLQRLEALLPREPPANALHAHAACEAIVRIYMRALGQLEATLPRHGSGGTTPSGAGGIRQPAPPSSAGTPRFAAAGGVCRPSWGTAGSQPPSGAASTLLEALLSHYSPPPAGQQALFSGSGAVCRDSGSSGGGAVAAVIAAATAPYDAALWRAPDGPVCRLLLSCRALAAERGTSGCVKAALFCCLAGLSPGLSPGGKRRWGSEHWRHFLLLLHALRRLCGGLWRTGVLREWASLRGALLPLACVYDLLANVYNVADVGLLGRIPAVLAPNTYILDAVVPPSSGADAAAAAAAATAAVGDAPELVGDAAQWPEVGNVAAAITDMMVQGPAGPAVDMDDLLAMLMAQYDAGLLPAHALLEPRRLGDGALANTANFSNAAVASAGTAASSGWRPPPLRAARMPSAGSPTADTPDAGTSDWGSLTSSSGWGAEGRPASAGERGVISGSGTPSGAGILLPRLRSPDSTSGGAGVGSGRAPRPASPLSGKASVRLQPAMPRLDVPRAPAAQ